MSFPVASALALKTAGTAAAPGYGFASYSGTGTFAASVSIGGTAYPFLGLTAGGAEVGRLVNGALGLGVAIPLAQVHAYGAGQSTTAVNTAVSTGGAVLVQDANGSAGNGGMLLFGAPQGIFACLKGLLINGAANTQGDVAISLRAAAGDAALSERWRWGTDGTYRPGADGAQDIGTASYRLRNAYLVNNPTVSSDATLKTLRPASVGGPSLSTAELAAWARVQPLVWTLNGDDAGLLHVGYIAQTVQAAFAAQGLDITRYALWRQDTLPGGATRCALVYAECAVFEAAYQRQQMALLAKQVKALADALKITLPAA